MFKITHLNDTARRASISREVSRMSTKETTERWEARMNKDEQFARSLGENTSYDDIMSHNSRLWRTTL